MSLKIRLLFGPLAAILFCSGIVVLGSFVTDYHQVRQTVSEIGEVGSPMQFPFTALLCATSESCRKSQGRMSFLCSQPISK